MINKDVAIEVLSRINCTNDLAREVVDLAINAITDYPIGKWTPVDDVFCQCSCCGNLDIMKRNYCSECGAKMEVE